MTSRLAGAILALTAAALLLGSIAGVPRAWWDGHPSMGAQLIDAKTVHVGPLSATGCNTGGDGVCSDLDMPDAFSILGWVVVVPVGVLALCLVLLGVTTLRRLEQRKLAATGVLVLGGVALLTGLMLIVHGAAPNKHADISLPIGGGLIMFFIGLVMAGAASVLSRRPFPRMELRPSRAALAPGLAAPQAAGLDVGALLEDDKLRPSRPRLGIGEPLPGPAGTLGAPSESPLFSGAPQLRPLYDAAPAQGGTSGYVPGAPPVLPTRAPTPLPQAQVASVMGLPTPPPFAAPVPSHAMIEPRTKPASVAAPPPRVPASRTNPPPAPRTNPPSIPPPAPSPSAPNGAGPASSPSGRARAQSVPPPPGSISARLKASSVPPPVRPGAIGAASNGGAEVPAGPRTSLGVAIPAPTTPRTLAGAVVPPPASSAQAALANAPYRKLPVRAETDDSDHFETVERPKEDIGDATDANVELPDDPGRPSDTEQGPAIAPPRADSQSETSGVEKVDRESASELATVARERISARAIGDAAATDESPVVPSPAAAKPAAASPIAAAASEAAPKIPISTAPDSLPPPTATQTATSGPSPACPQCEAPMAWVEEHLRFYCKSCRMYF